jgi:hypothetical protein
LLLIQAILLDFAQVVLRFNLRSFKAIVECQLGLEPINFRNEQ